jgi:long-chain fatty acid transport protein
MSFNKLTGSILIALASQAANASGFALIEQSASGQGLSYAGAAANAEDASVMWFNPAGLTEIEGSQAVLGAHVISPVAKFSDEGSTGPLGEFGGGGDDGATLGLVPNIYWKGKFGDYDAGLGINVPFGQHISYDDDWAGRYIATETNLKTLNINPAIARKINEQLSFGFGLNAQYVNLVMENKIDNRLVGGTGDANAKVTADSWAFGYNFGLLFKPTELTAFGLSYRSSVTHNAKGKVDYSDNLDDRWLPAKGLEDANISSTVNLPASASFSVKHQYSNKFEVLADATWTKWSDYKSLVIDYDDADSTQLDSNTRQDFKDSWRLSLGGIYQLNDDMKLRAGVAFDQTPVSDETNRSPRTPDSDRKWLSFGLGYKLNQSMNLDVGYTHIFAEKVDVNYTTDDRQYLVGSYDASVDILSAQLVWNY